MGQIPTDVDNIDICSIDNEAKPINDNDEIKIDINVQRPNRSKRSFIEAEIIATEETYCMLLRKLLNDIILPMFDEKLIDIARYEQMVSTLPKIVAFHKSFLRKLKQSENAKSLGLVFLECILRKKKQFIAMYVDFISNYQQICDRFMDLFDGNLRALEFLKERKLSTKMFLNFLILPVQRIPRYILLLNELRKSMRASSDIDEYEEIDCAVRMVKNITTEINEQKRAIDAKSEWREP